MNKNEKLDFLMNIFKTKNSDLAKELSFDTSYISRLRTGKRNFPNNEKLVADIALYFARNMSEDYQKNIISDIIFKNKEKGENGAETAEAIRKWLKDDSIENDFRTDKNNIFDDDKSIKPSENNFYYGDSGKRSAVLKFLEEICNLPHMPMLLLFSNEEFNWLFEEMSFSKKWEKLLKTFIFKGGKIKIIHNIDRGSGDMRMALHKWLPIYMTGAVEPFYYPKVMDRIYRRTLFIAEGHSALISNSVDKATENMLNMLIYDVEAVKALEEEFYNFYKLCKPLIYFYDLRNKKELTNVLDSFEKSGAKTYLALSSPSLFTLPREIAEKKTNGNNEDILDIYKRRNELFIDNLEKGSEITEIINLPQVNTVQSGEQKINTSDLFVEGGRYYTTEEFIMHLQSVIKYLKKYDSYRVVISSKIPGDTIIYVKDYKGAIVVRAKDHTIAFGINEQRLTTALYEYLRALSETDYSRENTIKLLEEYISCYQI